MIEKIQSIPALKKVIVSQEKAYGCSPSVYCITIGDLSGRILNLARNVSGFLEHYQETVGEPFEPLIAERNWGIRISKMSNKAEFPLDSDLRKLLIQGQSLLHFIAVKRND